MTLVCICIAFLVSYAAAGCGIYWLSGGILMAAAVLMAYHYYRKSGRRVCPPAVFSLSWIGGIGISCLKLSYLETDWELVTWICFLLAFIAFIAGYELICMRQRRSAAHCTKAAAEMKSDASIEAGRDKDTAVCFTGNIAGSINKAAAALTARYNAKAMTDSTVKAAVKADTENSAWTVRENEEDSAEGLLAHNKSMAAALLRYMDIIALVSVISFITEAVILGYVPLFTSDTPHAYSYFHVSGVHYFTVSCVLLPALGVLYFNTVTCGDIRGLFARKCSVSPLHITNAIICIFIGILLPVMLVSRYQLIFGLILAAFTYLVYTGARINIAAVRRYLPFAAAGVIMLILLYAFLSYERAHSIEYLNGIFEMKAEFPIFISQPYIYIANNFDNFNCLVRELPAFTHGLRMLFPVFALTGLKFVYPELAAFPIFVTKEELTTVTLIYDGYYDFGIAGVVILTLTIGAVSAILEQEATGVRTRGNDEQLQMDAVRRQMCSAETQADAAQAGISAAQTEMLSDTADCQAATAEADRVSAYVPQAFRLMWVLLYAQLLIYLCLAFFTTWFSNPTTWFYFGVTVVGMSAVLYRRSK